MNNLENVSAHSDILIKCLTRLKNVYNTDAEEILESRPNGLILLMDDDLRFRIRISKEADFIYLLHINDGVVKFIYEYCKIMLSDNNNFSNYGLSSHLINVPSTRYVEMDFGVLDAALGNCENYDLVIFDNKRETFLNYIFECCFQFIISHEYFHFYNGHLDYLFTVKKINEYIEGKLSLNVSPLDHQTLEMDADAKATVFLYDLMTDKYAFKSEYKLFMEGKDIEEIIYILGFVCLLIFRFTCLKVVDSIEEMKINSHPSGFQRLLYVANVVHQKVNIDGHHYTLEQIIDIFKRLISDFEKSISLITHKEESFKFYVFSDHNDAIEYGSKIIDNWKNLYPIIKVMAYGPVVEPRLNY